MAGLGGSLMFPGPGHGQGGSLAQQQLLAQQHAQGRPTGIRPAGPPPPQGPPAVGPTGRPGGAGSVLDLEAFPASQLEELLTNEEAFKEYAAAWLQATPSGKTLADIKAQNVAIAQDSLEMERAIEEAKTHVAIVKSGDYATMKSMFDDLYKRQEAVLAKMGPAVMLARLRAEAEQADLASDQLLEAFQADATPLEQLVEQYVAKREAFHTIDLKRQAAEHQGLG